MKWLQKFMDDRVGVDHLSLFLLIVGVIIQIVFSLLVLSGLVWLAYIPTLIGLGRALSKNKIKRHQENVLFLKYWYPIQSSWVNKYRGYKVRYKAKRQYRYFKCKSCKQKLRVPRKAMRVQITCPKCRETFIKETLRSKVKRLATKSAA